jgi:hypothetical protein
MRCADASASGCFLESVQSREQGLDEMAACLASGHRTGELDPYDFRDAAPESLDRRLGLFVLAAAENPWTAEEVQIVILESAFLNQRGKSVRWTWDRFPLDLAAASD